MDLWVSMTNFGYCLLGCGENWVKRDGNEVFLVFLGGMKGKG